MGRRQRKVLAVLLASPTALCSVHPDRGSVGRRGAEDARAAHMADHCLFQSTFRRRSKYSDELCFGDGMIGGERSIKMFTNEDAANALAELGLDLTSEGFGLDDLRRGMDVELEHGTRFADLNVTEDDPVVTAKIAVAHLREFSDYYDRLDAMEREADSARAAQLDEAGGII